MLLHFFLYSAVQQSQQQHFSELMHRHPRAGLSIGKTGQIPGASRLWGLTLEYQNTPICCFFVFLGC